VKKATEPESPTWALRVISVPASTAEGDNRAAPLRIAWSEVPSRTDDEFDPVERRRIAAGLPDGKSLRRLASMLKPRARAYERDEWQSE